jgi:hypothetical protein
MVALMSISDKIQLLILTGILTQAIIAFLSYRKFQMLDKRRATTLFLNDIRSQMNAARFEVDAFCGPEGTFDSVRHTPKQKIALILYLDLFEELGVGVNTGIYDAEIVMRLLGGFILNERRRFGHFIRQLRVDQRRMSIYCEFEEMASRIRATAPRSMLAGP